MLGRPPAYHVPEEYIDTQEGINKIIGGQMDRIREILEDMLVEFARGKGASIVIREALSEIEAILPPQS